MAYRITRACLRCGICIPECPAGAISAGNRIEESDGLILYPVSINTKKCNDCGVCVSEEYWCPAHAIVRA